MAHHLLLADDSVTIQRVIKLTFADEDVEVVTVGDGNQAVASIDRQPPDIVLADVAMPGRSGYEVAQHIRKSPRLAHIPVLLLTGAFEPVDEARAEEVGCDGVLAKPFEPDLVVSRVKELLARPRQAASAPEAPAAAVVSQATAAASTAPDVPPVGATVIPMPTAATRDAAGAMTAPPPAADARGPIFPAPVAPVAAPAGRSANDVDAYFERLDQAFATLALSPRTPSPSPGAEAEAPSMAPAISDALAGLTATGAPTALPMPAPATAPVPPALTDAQVDQIVDRVLDRLTTRLGVNLADVVSTVAERVVRAEIDQIKKRV